MQNDDDDEEDDGTDVYVFPYDEWFRQWDWTPDEENVAMDHREADVTENVEPIAALWDHTGETTTFWGIRNNVTDRVCADLFEQLQRHGYLKPDEVFRVVCCTDNRYFVIVYKQTVINEFHLVWQFFTVTMRQVTN